MGRGEGNAVSGNSDGFTSEDRNLMRIVESYGGPDVTPKEAARMLGTSSQRVAAMASLLARAGFMKVSRDGRGATYAVTDAGRAELAARQTTYLLVKVDDRLADEVAYYLARGVNGITEVTAHNEDYPDGCCCQHCPHNGNCR